MAISEVLAVIRNIVVDGYKNMFFSNNNFSKYARYTFIVAGICVSGLSGYYVYSLYISNRESAAQKVFSECIVDFENAKKGIGSWDNVQVAFQMGHKQNSGSMLAPYFKAFEADSLYEQGKNKEAIETLANALEDMKSDLDMFSLYKTKLALMKFDSKRENLKAEGLKELESIAGLGDKSDKATSGRGVALYYLGSYFLGQNNIEKAKEAWEKLVALEVEKEGPVSGYIGLAKEKLNSLN